MKRIVLIVGLIITVSLLSGCDFLNDDEKNYAPVISSDELISVSYGEDPEWTNIITITDYEDGVIRPSLDMFDLGNFDSTVIGTYTIGVYAIDSDNKTTYFSFEVEVIDTRDYEIGLLGEERITLEVGSVYEEMGVYTKSSDGREDIPYEIITDLDVQVIGEYEVRYVIFGRTESVVRNISVVDSTHPNISLIGSEIQYISLNSYYEDPGVVVTDNYYPNELIDVRISGEIEYSTPGNYKLIYQATDGSGNVNSIERTIIVIDGNIPMIVLNDESYVEVEINSSYIETGATFIDENGFFEVSTLDTFDITTIGDYILNYNYTDENNENYSISKTINVIDTTSPEIIYSFEPLEIKLGEVLPELEFEVIDNSLDEIFVSIDDSNVNYEMSGEYVVLISAEDSSGNNTNLELSVIIIKNTPIFETVNIEPSYDRITYNYDLSDLDGTILSTSIGLYLDDLLIDEAELNLNNGTSIFEGLSINTEYVVKVIINYNLGNGGENQTIIETISTGTRAIYPPDFITTTEYSDTSICYNIEIDDVDQTLIDFRLVLLRASEQLEVLQMTTDQSTYCFNDLAPETTYNVLFYYDYDNKVEDQPQEILYSSNYFVTMERIVSTITIEYYEQLTSDYEIEQVSTNGRTVMVLTKSNELFGWGLNQASVILGNDSLSVSHAVNMTPFLPLEEGEIITKIHGASGYDFMTILTSKGNLYGWGNYQSYGSPYISTSKTPILINSFIPLQTNEFIVDYIFSAESALVITSEKRIFTWGSNYSGQLGVGTRDRVLSPIEITPSVELGENEEIIQIEGNNNVICLLTDTSRIICTGKSDYTFSDNNLPIDLTSLLNLEANDQIIDIAVSEYKVIVLTKMGDIIIWGGGSRYLPYESFSNIRNQFILYEGETITNIESNSNEIFAITSLGRIFTWAFFWNVLSDGIDFDMSSPQVVFQDFSTSSNISIEANYSIIAIYDDLGNFKMYGSNVYNSLGGGVEYSSNIPTDVTENIKLENDEVIVDMTMGNFYSGFLTSDHSVYVYGSNISNLFSQVDSGVIFKTPYNITSLFGLHDGETVASIALAEGGGILATSNERIIVFNREGIFDITIFFDLSNGDSVKELFYDEQSISVLTEQGKLYIWGDNDYGQVGNGNYFDTQIPYLVNQSMNLEEGEVIVQYFDSYVVKFAITSNNRIFSWGANAYHTLLDESSINSSIPIDITSNLKLNEGESIVKIIPNYRTVHVLTSAHRILYWGSSNIYPLELVVNFSLDEGEFITDIFTRFGEVNFYLTNFNKVVCDSCWEHDFTYGIIDSLPVSYFLPEDKIVKEIYASYGEIVIIMEDNTIITWGDNSSFQLLRTDLNNGIIPVYIKEIEITQNKGEDVHVSDFIDFNFELYEDEYFINKITNLIQPDVDITIYGKMID
jgi:alpha-tubulin suppressor-like RCC1 family protein